MVVCHFRASAGLPTDSNGLILSLSGEGTRYRRSQGLPHRGVPAIAGDPRGRRGNTRPKRSGGRGREAPESRPEGAQRPSGRRSGAAPKATQGSGRTAATRQAGRGPPRKPRLLRDDREADILTDLTRRTSIGLAAASAATESPNATTARTRASVASENRERSEREPLVSRGLLCGCRKKMCRRLRNGGG